MHSSGRQLPLGAGILAVVLVCLALGLWGSGALEESSGVSDSRLDAIADPVELEPSSVRSVSTLEDSDPGTFEIEIVGFRGRPIPGASLGHIGTEDSVLEVGTPRDEPTEGGVILDGILTLPDSSWGLPLVARAPNYLDKPVEWPDVAQPSVRITLDPKAVLRGGVRKVGGLPMEGPLRVAVWPEALPATMADVEAALVGQGTHVRVVECDSLGRFAIAVGSAEAKFAITAGGVGHAMCTPVFVTTSAQDGPVALQVLPVFGCVVRLETPGGECVRMSEKMAPQLGPGWIALPGGESLNPTGPSIALAGISSPMVDPKGSRVVRPMMALDTSLRSVGPIPFDAKLPGYGKSQMEIMLDWIGLGLAEVTWTIYPTAPGFGVVRLEFDPDTAKVLAKPGGRRTSARLSLSPGGGESSIRYFLQGIDGGVEVIRDVPFGRYRAFLFDWGNERIDLVPDEPEQNYLDIEVNSETTVVRVPKLRFATIEVRPHLGNGDPYQGRLSLSIGRMIKGTQNRRATLAYFDQGPYVVPFSRGGTFAGNVIQPWIQDLVAEEGILFDVAVGEHRVIELTVPEEAR